MGIAEDLIFKEDLNGAEPKAIFICVDSQKKVKTFEVGWDNSSKDLWFKRLLPASVMYYRSSIVPNILMKDTLQQLDKSGSISSPNNRFCSQPTPATTAVPSATTESGGPSSFSISMVSPVLKTGKTVFIPSKSRTAIIKEVDEKAETVLLSGEDGNTPVKRKHTAFKSVRVIPIDGDNPPRRSFQHVMVNKASEKLVDLIGKEGRVVSYGPDMCLVQLNDIFADDGNGNLQPLRKKIKTEYLYALNEAPPAAKTAKTDLKRHRVHYQEWTKWFDNFQFQSKVKYIGHTTDYILRWGASFRKDFTVNKQAM